MADLPEHDEYCPVRSAKHGEEETHCAHWWDGDGCCACGARAMTNDEKRELGMDVDEEEPHG